MKELHFQECAGPAYLCEIMGYRTNQNTSARYGIVYKGEKDRTVEFRDIGHTLTVKERGLLKDRGYVTYVTTCVFFNNVPVSFRNEFIREVEPINIFSVDGRKYFTLPFHTDVCSFNDAVSALLGK